MTSPILPNERPTRSLSEFEFIQESGSKDSKLGKGSFANVQLAREKKSGNLIAMKVINSNLSTASKSEIHNLQTEIKTHRELNHPNIIKFYDYIQEGLNIYLILEYAPNGNLYSYINKKKSLSQTQIFRFFYQSCLAIQYLHQKDILHRDLKPENLLLDKDLNIKLCDFGWAARSIKEKRTTFCGTYEYMAPEIVDKKTYDYRVDIWSLGVLLYELVHGEAPYQGRSLPEITASFARGPFKFRSPIAPDLKDLIQRILQNNPEDRISLNEILSHDWVKKNLGQSNSSQNNNHNSTKSVDSLKNLTRIQTSREGESQYNPIADKENAQGKVSVHQYTRGLENQVPRDEIARALANFNHAAEHFPESRRRVDRPEMLPGLLIAKENYQGRPQEKVVVYKSQERGYATNSNMQLLRTFPAPEILDAFSEQNNRARVVERSMTSSNLKYYQTEMDSNLNSQNTSFDKGDSQMTASVMKGYNNQRARELLKKAESTRNYYVRPNYYENGAEQPQQQQLSSHYSSNLIVHTPQHDNRMNYSIMKYQAALKPHHANYDPRAVHNDYEDNTQWKNSNVALKTETFRMGGQRMAQYENYSPVPQGFEKVKTGLTTLRSLPVISYSKSQGENDPMMSLSPYYNQNMTAAGGWYPAHMSVRPMGMTMSGGNSPLVMNERYQSSK